MRRPDRTSVRARPNSTSRPAADPPTRAEPPIYERVLQPHRSLSLAGFRHVILLTTAGLGVSLLPFLGSSVGWALLPFLVFALLALYVAICLNYRDAALREELKIWPDLITVRRVTPKGRVQSWNANPYWVTAQLHTRARIESYLTLKGNGREIELGAFLSPDERVCLHSELNDMLHRTQLSN
ncbi:MAG: DUF2244 domain-containing protein [Pseudomonadota bacterium]